MTYTYSLADLATSTLHRTRFRTGDNVSTEPLLQDEEINQVLADESDEYFAAAQCCEYIAAGFARKVDKAVGNLRIAAQQKFEHYTALATQLRRRSDLGLLNPFAGGISVADKQARQDNTDNVLPAFNKSLFAEPGTGLPPNALDPTLVTN